MKDGDLATIWIEYFVAMKREGAPPHTELRNTE
jgi:hypothetical protein